MKTKTLISILILALSVQIISSCTTTPKPQVEEGGASKQEFFSTIKDGDAAEVQRLIDAGTDVNIRDNKGFSALMVASVEGHVEITKLLIKKGANVNTQANNGSTALVVAYVSRQSNSDTFHFFLSDSII